MTTDTLSAPTLAPVATLAIDGDRLWESLMTLARIGATDRRARVSRQDFRRVP